MANSALLRRLRENPSNISDKELEEELILGYLKIENYDVLIQHKLANSIIQTFVDMEEIISKVQNQTILDVNLIDGDSDNIVEMIEMFYCRLCAIKGLWSTGASKILHLANDKLFPVVTSNTMAHLNIPPQGFKMAEFMRRVQYKALEVTTEFAGISDDRTVDVYLSDKMGYSRKGCQKSLVKFIDEYYCMVSEGLSIPPIWTPHEDEKEDIGRYKTAGTTAI